MAEFTKSQVKVAWCKSMTGYNIIIIFIGTIFEVIRDQIVIKLLNKGDDNMKKSVCCSFLDFFKLVNVALVSKAALSLR